MRKLNLLLAIGCLLAIHSCQKETVAPLPELSTITTETTDESLYFKINTVEDLATFEELFVQNGSAVSRSNLHGKIVHVPNNSKNALQAAIADAGRYGLVVLAKGSHYEEETIVIDHPVYILGRKGAMIIAGSELSDVGVINPIFSIRQTTRVTIWGVAMQGKEGGSSAAIEILNATHTVLSKNTINNFQLGIMVNEGDHTLCWKNEIVGGVNFPITVGMGIINGVDIRILQNKITGFGFGFVGGGQDGIIQGNELFGNQTGLSLSNIPPVIETSEGNIVGAKVPPANCSVHNNYAHDNQFAGIELVDGVNNNTLINNRGGNNAIDLVLDADGFNILGIPTKATFDNFVDVRDNTDFTYVDCGNNNRVKGGVQIPCN